MLIRILEMPNFAEGFRFGGNVTATFKDLDWFRDDPHPDDMPELGTAEWRAYVEDFVRGKKYFNSERAYLVLHPVHPFTINYRAN
jgi:hypothetical protein